jgi:hypothetical protein
VPGGKTASKRRYGQIRSGLSRKSAAHAKGRVIGTMHGQAIYSVLKEACRAARTRCGRAIAAVGWLGGLLARRGVARCEARQEGMFATERGDSRWNESKMRGAIVRGWTDGR